MAKKLVQQNESAISSTVSKNKEFDLVEVLDLHSTIEKVLSRVTPAWDTRDYVAVNPLFGYRDQESFQVIQRIQSLRGTLLLPERRYLKDKYEAQKIQNKDLSYALMLYQSQTESNDLDDIEFDELLDFLDSKHSLGNSIPKVQCLTDLYDLDLQLKETEKVTNEISKWLSAYFDEGQSMWKLPKSPLGLFATWKNIVKFDQSQIGIENRLNELIETLPNKPEQAIHRLCSEIYKAVQLNEDQFEMYFERLLATVPGWAAFVKKIDFENDLLKGDSKPADPTSLLDLLVIRLAYDVSYLKETLGLKNLGGHQASASLDRSGLVKNYLWLLADEIATRRQISERIKFDTTVESQKRPLAQMAFCIDVRSEVIRRHIEAESMEIETIGFAGFFGVPIAMKKLGFEGPDHQCPVLIKPAFEVTESSHQPDEIISRRKSSFFRKYGMKASLQSSHSSFSLAETFGFSYAGKMLLNALGITKPNVNFESMDEKLELDTNSLSIDSKVQLAYGALFNMGLTKRFGKHIIFFGHGGESANNPYQGALDCGACAGHNGQYNSEFLASILNDQNVRSKLKEKGIQIPKDTQFFSGWHNTTTDELNISKIAENKEFEEIEQVLSHASNACRKERAQLLVGEKIEENALLEKELQTRAQDWSEARPEWALARNNSFIIARRDLTRNVDLEGRSFLHDYDQSTDPDLKKLELIMTAPMVVTNWINMQYFASTIDPENFGTGNKVLNNVVGTIGCIQGNQSDLLTGLSEQSVRLKGRYFHEPVRLQVFIEAATSSIDQIIDKHPMVSDLISNGWLNVISINAKQENFKLRLKNKWIDMKEALWN